MTSKLDSLLPKCREMLSAENDVEGVLLFLRQQGCSKFDAIKALAVLKNLNLLDAKHTVHFSETWADVRQQDEDFELAFWEELIRLTKEMESE